MKDFFTGKNTMGFLKGSGHSEKRLIVKIFGGKYV